MKNPYLSNRLNFMYNVNNEPVVENIPKSINKPLESKSNKNTIQRDETYSNKNIDELIIEQNKQLDRIRPSSCNRNTKITNNTQRLMDDIQSKINNLLSEKRTEVSYSSRVFEAPKSEGNKGDYNKTGKIFSFDNNANLSN